MNREALEHFAVTVLGVPVSDTSAGWLTIPCPMAPWRHQSGQDNNPSMGLKIAPGGSSHCHCLACNYGGSLASLLIELKLKCGKQSDIDFARGFALINNEADDALSEAFSFSLNEGEKKTGLYPFPDEWINSFPLAEKSPAAMEYLTHGRKGGAVPLTVIRALDLRWDGKQSRVCFPVRDLHGNYAGLHGRAIDGSQPKYRMYTYKAQNNPEVWLGEHWLNPDKVVLVVESVFDLARAYQVYRNVVCPLTASLSPAKLDRIKRLDCWGYVTAFDPDKAGKAAHDMFKSYLKPKFLRKVYIPGTADPGDHSAQSLGEILEKYVELDDLILA